MTNVSFIDSPAFFGRNLYGNVMTFHILILMYTLSLQFRTYFLSRIKFFFLPRGRVNVWITKRSSIYHHHVRMYRRSRVLSLRTGIV